MLALNREMMATFVSPDVVGVVRLGAPDDMSEHILPDLLYRFAQTHCAITVDVVVDSSSNLRHKITAGELDLAMVTCAPNTAQADELEILFEEPLTWAGARHGIAHEQNPLPISVWDEGCSWRNAGIKSLEKCDRDYRIAFMSAHIAGQRAAIMAGLAVAPIPVSACINGIVALGEQQGLPLLGSYALAMILSKEISRPAEAAADHLRACFAAQRATSLSVVGGMKNR
jgi:DNA-binding transcriptional LysR family regulator